MVPSETALVFIRIQFHIYVNVYRVVNCYNIDMLIHMLYIHK